MGRPQALIVLAMLAGPAIADPVTAPDPIAGDGRSIAPIFVTGDPVKGVKELPVPEVASVTCSGASGLAAPKTENQPAVLAPVVTRPTTLDCVARLRAIDSKFRLTVRPPPEGLYATSSAYGVRSTAKDVTLDPLVWTGSARAAAGSVQAAASDGKIELRGGKLVIGLAGNAPRLIAVALASGDRIGAAFVPITGVTTIPVESEPGASVQVWIAGRWFGPVKTKGRIAQVPIEVPPGVTHGVARSTGREGYITDAITDLKVPSRPRIAAAVASPQIRAGQPATIAIAIAGSDGRPGGQLPVSGSATRGTVDAIKPLGGGLWSARYTAPVSAGADRVTIRVDGDKSAGAGEVVFEVTAGAVSRIELEVAPGPYEPGAEITGTAHVFDGSGNPVHDAAVTATLGGAPLTVTRGDPTTFRGKIPERLPAGELALEVSTGGAHEHRVIAAGGAATTASVHATVDGRGAIAELAVRDRFGNLVPDGAFDVEVTGARLIGQRRGERVFEATLAALPGVANARIVVRAKGAVLADEAIRFEPPASALVLGAWGSGGYVDNLGVLASPRASAGLGIRRGLAVEIALLIGVEGLAFSDTTPIVIDGMSFDAARKVRGIGVTSLLRARVRLTRRFGAALGAGVIPMRMKISLAPGAQSADDYGETVFGVRAQAQLDARVGPGRLFVGGAYGRAHLSQGVVVGQIDGVAVIGGYEWWFAALGR